MYFISGNSSNTDITLKKVTRHTPGLRIHANPLWPQPKVGDKIEITSWDMQDNVQECVRLSKLPYLTVKSIHPVVVGMGNDINSHSWAYDVQVNETTKNIVFIQFYYKILPNDNQA